MNIYSTKISIVYNKVTIIDKTFKCSLHDISKKFSFDLSFPKQNPLKKKSSKILYNIKEKAARTENAILIPIAMLQFTPIIVFMLLPTLSIINLL